MTRGRGRLISEKERYIIIVVGLGGIVVKEFKVVCISPIKGKRYVADGIVSGKAIIKIHGKEHTYINRVGMSALVCCTHAVIRYWKGFKVSKHSVYYKEL